MLRLKGRGSEMKKVVSVLTLFFILFLTGCSLDFNLNNDKVLCNGEERSEVTAIEDVYDLSDDKEVTVCGVITAWDGDDNFFIQDSTTGVYVYGDENLGGTISHAEVGKTVLLKATKTTHNGLEQLKVDLSSRYEVLNQDDNRVEPIEVVDFSDLDSYEFKLIKLIDVKLGDANSNNRRSIIKRNGDAIAYVYGGPEIESAEHVDIIGVFVNQEGKQDGFIISDASDVTNSSVLTNAQKLLNARELLSVKTLVINTVTLPLTLDNDITVSWESNDDRVVISDDGVINYPEDATENISFTLTATLSIEGEESITKSFSVTLKKGLLYEVPTTFNYDGPVFPTAKVSIDDFWSGNSGLISATLGSCVDGDTARFNFVDVNGRSTNESFRFLVVDTAETNHPTIGAEPFGKPASVYTCKLLSDAEEIYLQSDPVSGSRDDHGRMLGWIWADGELVQYNLVALGLADTKYAYYDDEAELYADLLIAREVLARDEEVGRWSDLLDPYWDYENNKKLGW